MQCPKCEVTMHVDNSGISSCVSCGHRIDMNSEEYKHSTLEESKTYSNKGLMERENSKTTVKRYGTYNINGREVTHDELLELAEVGRKYVEKPTNDAGEKLQSTEETLKERGNRYGEFAQHAVIATQLKQIIDDNLEVVGAECYMYESLHMIAHKIARILNGDPYYDDSWRDIAGYAELVVKELNNES